MASRGVRRRQPRTRPAPGEVRAVLDGYAALAGVPAPVVDATCPAAYQLPDGGAVAADPSPRRVSIPPCLRLPRPRRSALRLSFQAPGSVDCARLRDRERPESTR